MGNKREPGQGGRVAPAAGAVDSAGLVSLYASDTSDVATGPEDQRALIEIDAVAARLARMKTAVLSAARLLEAKSSIPGSRAWSTIMITLTYRHGEDWRPGHISSFMKTVREHLRRRQLPLRAVWVAELQERGAIHYHVLVWLPPGVRLPKPDEYGWWLHGMTRIERARQPVAYLAKYASKIASKHALPPRARMTGANGLDAKDRMMRRFYRLPLWVARQCSSWEDDVRRAVGGGYVARASGEWFPSRFELVVATAKRIFFRLRVDAIVHRSGGCPAA